MTDNRPMHHGWSDSEDTSEDRAPRTLFESEADNSPAAEGSLPLLEDGVDLRATGQRVDPTAWAATVRQMVDAEILRRAYTQRRPLMIGHAFAGTNASSIGLKVAWPIIIIFKAALHTSPHCSAALECRMGFGPANLLPVHLGSAPIEKNELRPSLHDGDWTLSKSNLSNHRSLPFTPMATIGAWARWSPISFFR